MYVFINYTQLDFVVIKFQLIPTFLQYAFQAIDNPFTKKRAENFKKM
jgi:hypothetical protein